MVRTALQVVTALSLLSTLALADTPPYSRGSKINSTKSSYKVGGDTVKFGVVSANGCDETSLKNAARSVKNNATTDRWDDKWYAFRVAPGECIVIAWYDLTSLKFGWAGIQNQPNAWTVRSNSAGWTTLPNDQQKKYSYRINSQTVDLDIFNPKNEGALNGNDILVSFGF